MASEPRDHGFADRIEAALRHHSWSLSEWGRRAGIGKGPMSRLRTRGPSNATIETMIKVADAAQVELRWLADGEGPMLRGLPVDVAGRRALAAQLAEEYGVSQAAIEEALAAPVSRQDSARPTIWWVDRIREAALVRVRAEQGPGAAKEEPLPASEPTSSKERPSRRRA